MSALYLRDYQQDAILKLREALSKYRSCVYTLPTGGGKTVVAAEIARLAALKGARTAFLVHRRELVAQAVQTLSEAVPDVSIGIEAAGFPAKPWAKLTVGMVQSIVRRPHVLSQKFDLVVVDEAHHARAATWEKVLSHWQEAKVLGLTATPERLDGQGLHKHFDCLVQGPSVSTLVKAGSLCPIKVFRLPKSLDTTGLKANRMGEYRSDAVNERLTGQVAASAADSYLRYAKGLKALFFGITRKHSEMVCESLRERGVTAQHVDGETHQARRDKLVAEFRTGGIQVLGNCELFTEGVDVPSCHCVILQFATKSVTKYLQAAGRMMRPEPGKTGMLLDLMGVSHDDQLGLPDDIREWSLEDGEVRKQKEKKRDTKECPQCHHVYRYGPPACPVCSYQAPVTVPDQVEVELERARTTGEVRRRTPRRELYAALAKARTSSDPVVELMALARERGYKAGWVHHVLNNWRQKGVQI